MKLRFLNAMLKARNEASRGMALQADFLNDVLKTIDAGKDNTAGHTFDNGRQ